MDNNDLAVDIQSASPDTAAVVFYPNRETIDTFLFRYFMGFDLDGLLTSLDEVALSRSFTWTKREVRVSDGEELKIHHESDFSPRPLSVIRVLVKPDGERRVVHEEMVIPAPLQKKGLSRQFMRPYFEQYQKAEVDCIEVYAAMERGGYAWAKYGFSAVNSDEVFNVLSKAYGKGIPLAAIQKLHADASRFYAENGITAHFPMHLWAELPFSELLLSDCNWQGIINLHDQDQVEIFKTYLYKARPLT